MPSQRRPPRQPLPAELPESEPDDKACRDNWQRQSARTIGRVRQLKQSTTTFSRDRLQRQSTTTFSRNRLQRQPAKTFSRNRLQSDAFPDLSENFVQKFRSKISFKNFVQNFVEKYVLNNFVNNCRQIISSKIIIEKSHLIISFKNSVSPKVQKRCFNVVCKNNMDQCGYYSGYYTEESSDSGIWMPSPLRASINSSGP